MRVDFEKVQIVGYLRGLLIEKLGSENAKALLTTLQTGAAILTKGIPHGQKDRDLVRAIVALREKDGICKFADAVDALSHVILTAVSEDEQQLKLITPHGIIKMAARSAGHEIGRDAIEIDPLDEPAEDRNGPTENVDLWCLRRRDQGHRHGSLLPVSDAMILDLRDALSASAGMIDSSASRLLTGLVKAGALAMYPDRHHQQPATVDIGSMSAGVGALADLACTRLGLDTQNRQRDLDLLDDESVAVLALVAAFASTSAEIDDLLAMSKKDRLLALHTLGNHCKTWVETGRCYESDRKKPALRRALRKAQAAQTAQKIAKNAIDLAAFKSTASAMGAMS